MIRNPWLGLFTGATALVVSSDVPAAFRTAARFARTLLGDRIQICDGTDDHEEINVAISTGGRLVQLIGRNFSIGDGQNVLPGTGIFVYVSVRVPANTHLQGEGVGITTLTYDGTIAALNQDRAMVGVAEGQYIALHQNEPPPVHDVTIEDMTVDMNSLASRGYEFKSSYRVWLKRCEAKGLTSFAGINNYGISLGVSAFADGEYGDLSSEDCIVTGDNTALGLGQHGFISDGQKVTGVRHINPTVIDCAIGVSIADGARSVLVENLHARGCANNAIRTGAGPGRNYRGLQIKGGWLQECGSSNVDSVIEIGNCDDYLIDGTDIRHTGALGTAPRGIHLIANSVGRIMGHYIKGCDVGIIQRLGGVFVDIGPGLVEECYGSGIYIRTGRARITSTSRNNGQDATRGGGERCGLTLWDVDNCVLTGGDYSDDQDAATQQYGIAENIKGGNLIVGNRTVGNVLKGVSAFGTTMVRDNLGHVTENNVLSPAFAIDAVAVVTVTIPHGCRNMPAVEACQLTVVEDTAVDDWEYGFVKVVSTGAANVVAKVNVTNASVTVGATAKLALRVDLSV